LDYNIIYQNIPITSNCDTNRILLTLSSKLTNPTLSPPLIRFRILVHVDLIAWACYVTVLLRVTHLNLSSCRKGVGTVLKHLKKKFFKVLIISFKAHYAAIIQRQVFCNI